jgi:hypothetical protein
LFRWYRRRTRSRSEIAARHHGHASGSGQRRPSRLDSRKRCLAAGESWTEIELNDQSLVPGDNPRIGATRFDGWLSQTTRQK